MKKRLNFLILLTLTVVILIYSIAITIQYFNLNKMFTLVSNNYLDLTKFEMYNNRDLSGSEAKILLENLDDDEISVLVKNNEEFINYGALLVGTREDNTIYLSEAKWAYNDLSKTNKFNKNISNIYNKDSNEYISDLYIYNSKLIEDDKHSIIGIALVRINNND